MSQTYNVILTGKVLNNAEATSAHSAFAKLFKKSEDQARSIFAQAPTCIKRNVDEATAKKFKAALTRSNIEVKVQVGQAALSSDLPPKESSNTSTPSSQLAPQDAPAPNSAVENQQKTVLQSNNPEGFSFRIEGKPDFAFATIELGAEETLKVEASSMATMDTHIRMKTKMKGGFGRLLTGESLFINDFTAEGAPGEVGVAPSLPGDIVHRHLAESETLYLRNSSYLASCTNIAIETKLDIFKGIFSGAGLILIKCSGPGDLWFNTYGAAIEIEVDGEYVVDTDKIIAWTDGLEYNISSVGGYKSFFLSGEGFVCRFKGRGKLWVQSRSSKAFTSWAHWFRPLKGKN